MEPDEVLCQSCGRFGGTQRAAAKSGDVQSAPLLARFQAWIDRWESRHGEYGPVLSRVDLKVTWFDRKWQIALGLIFLILSSAYAARELTRGDFLAGFWGDGRIIAAFLILGIAFLLGRRILNPVPPAEPRTERYESSPAIFLLGTATNLAYWQIIAAGVTFYEYWRLDLATARTTALIAIILAAVLWSTRARWLACVIGVACAIYLLWDYSEYDFITKMDHMYRSLYTNLILHLGEPWFWTTIFLSLFPQLQLAKVGSLGVGRVWGDVSFRLYATKVPVPFGSALLIVCVVTVLTNLPYIPRLLL